MGPGMGMGWGWGWGWLFWLLVLAGLILLVVLAVRLVAGGVSRSDGGVSTAAQPPARNRARELLYERYARGELTTEEYRERLQILREER